MEKRGEKRWRQRKGLLAKIKEKKKKEKREKEEKEEKGREEMEAEKRIAGRLAEKDFFIH